MVEIRCNSEEFMCVDQYLMSIVSKREPRITDFKVVTELSVYLYTVKKEFGLWFIVPID
jgi:hypothetical protein